jgi:hypothetical protein
MLTADVQADRTLNPGHSGSDLLDQIGGRGGLTLGHLAGLAGMRNEKSPGRPSPIAIDPLKERKTTFVGEVPTPTQHSRGRGLSRHPDDLHHQRSQVTDSPSANSGPPNSLSQRGDETGQISQFFLVKNPLAHRLRELKTSQALLQQCLTTKQPDSDRNIFTLLS